MHSRKHLQAFLHTLFILSILPALHATADKPSSEQLEHISLTLGEESERQEVKCREWLYYTAEVTEACLDLRVKVNNLEGEPDLYITRGSNKYPTINSLAWSSYNWGSENLTISSWDPEFVVGTYYIGVHAYCGDDVLTGETGSIFTILVESVPTTHPHEEIFLNGQVFGHLDPQEYNYFRFCIPDSCYKVEVKLENCIDPEACPSQYTWPELLVSRSIVTPTINDHAWKLASIETRSVEFDHDDPDFYPGHFFVGVYGWCTPDDQCPDPAYCGPCSNYGSMVDSNYNVSLIVKEISSGCKSKQPLSLCEGGDPQGNKTGALKPSVMIIMVVLSIACSLLI